MKKWLVLFVVFSFYGCNDNAPRHKPWNNLLEETAPMSDTPPDVDWSKYQAPPVPISQLTVFPKNTLLVIEKNPNKHIGELYAFLGQVMNIQEANGKTVFQMYAMDFLEDDNFDRPCLMVTMDWDDTHIIRNHIVKILGTIDGEVSGQNAFGGTISNIVLKAKAACDLNTGQIYFYPSDENYKKWRKGELFPDIR